MTTTGKSKKPPEGGFLLLLAAHPVQTAQALRTCGLARR
jgi:hypothetical protein